MRLWISKSNIENGLAAMDLVATRSYSDPIAQHLKGLFPNTPHISIGTSSVYLGKNKNERKRFAMGKNGNKFVKNFDDKGSVEPAYVTIIDLESYVDFQPEIDPNGPEVLKVNY